MGNVVQFVNEDKRAWHAGYGAWQVNEDVNSSSIGIETVNLGFRESISQSIQDTTTLPGGQTFVGDPRI